MTHGTADVKKSSSSKADGALLLLRALRCHSLRVAMLFSSISFVANHWASCRGTASYSAANNYADILAATSRRDGGLTTTCLHLGLVAEQGAGALVHREVRGGAWWCVVVCGGA